MLTKYSDGDGDGRVLKTWCDCVAEEMKSFGLSWMMLISREQKLLGLTA